MASQPSMALVFERRRAAFTGLTPLIDMIFLLLLFFLLGSDFVHFSQMALSAPRGGGGSEGTSQPAIIALAANGATAGSIQWNQEPIALAQITLKARTHLKADSDMAFIVMPEGKVQVQRIVQVMDALAVAGAERIALERDIFDIDLDHF